MPRYTPSILISDCWGSVGDLTFYHSDGQCYYKKKARGRFPGTTGQLDSLAVHRRALTAWRGLEHDVQLRWNELAKPVISHKPPFDNTAHISGQNLFVSAYHGFATLGDEHVPSPQAWASFPAYSIEFERAVVEGSTLRLCFKTFFPAGQTARRYHVLMKVRLGVPGSGSRPGMLRNFLAEGPCSDGGGKVWISIDNYRVRWVLDLPSYQVQCRCILLDRMTGYRSQYRPMSFVCNLHFTS